MKNTGIVDVRHYAKKTIA